MSPIEALNKILNDCPKNQLWCAVTSDEREQIWLRVTALRIKQGNVKPSTMRKFFSHFGYEVEVNMEVRRK